MKWWPLVFLLLVSNSGRSDWLALSDLSVDFTHFFPKGRNPLVTQYGLPNKEMGARVGLNFEVETGPCYWWNRVHGAADRDRGGSGGQFRQVGWNFEVGCRVIPKVDLYYTHHSQHVLDHAYDPGYSVEDGVGFRLRILGGKR